MAGSPLGPCLLCGAPKRDSTLRLLKPLDGFTTEFCCDLWGIATFSALKVVDSVTRVKGPMSRVEAILERMSKLAVVFFRFELFLFVLKVCLFSLIGLLLSRVCTLLVVRMIITIIAEGA